MKKRSINLLLVLTLPILFTACAQTGPSYRLGQFTAASSHVVRGLKYSKVEGTKMATYGEDCYKVGALPNDFRLQRAMDAAVENGQKKGLDGDLLVNVRIDQGVIERNTGVFDLPEAYNCISVKGDLVKIVK